VFLKKNDYNAKKLCQAMKRGIVFLIILLVPLSCNLFAQKQGKRYYITGQVLDLNDKPVSGAIVLVDNRNTQVVTDERGLYKVRVKTNATTISVFKSPTEQQDAEIKGRKVVNFKLESGTLLHPPEEQVKTESEKISVGYGYVEKKDVTTRVSKIDGLNNKNTAYSTIYQMLQRDPSVQVIGNMIFIRGVGSNINTDPLLIVDGMIVESIDNISPIMVKSIEILKGSEASIYGARGANGVIMITLIGNDNM
jgi:TonB-dependent SusC/RagA subfamily outer membrane receptor